MNKFILLVLTLLVIMGCRNTATNSIPVGEGLHDAHLYEIDSCEYIAWAGGVTHKGNCRFCAERRKQELKEQLNKK